MTRLYTALLVGLLVTLPFAALAPAQGLTSRSPAPSECPVGSARIAIDQDRIPEGKECELEYTFYTTGYTRVVYNPFFLGLIERPGQIVVSGDQGVLVRDAIQFCNGSRRGSNCDDWVQVNYGGHIGARITFRLVECLGTASLPPGRYQVQLILTKAFLAPRSRACGGYFEGKPSDQFDRSPLCSSNVVEIEVVKTDPVGAPN